MNMNMNTDIVNLLLPQVRLAARIDCYDNDEIECDLEIVEFKLLSLNLFDAQNAKFFARFNAKVKIEFWYQGRQESIVISAEDFELSSVDQVGDYISDFEIESCTFYLGDLKEIFGEQTIVSFYTLTK